MSSAAFWAISIHSEPSAPVLLKNLILRFSSLACFKIKPVVLGVPAMNNASGFNDLSLSKSALKSISFLLVHDKNSFSLITI